MSRSLSSRSARSGSLRVSAFAVASSFSAVASAANSLKNSEFSNIFKTTILLIFQIKLVKKIALFVFNQSIYEN